MNVVLPTCFALVKDICIYSIPETEQGAYKNYHMTIKLPHSKQADQWMLA